MRPTNSRSWILVAAVAAVAAAAPGAALAQSGPSIEKYIGPKCFSTVIPQVATSLARVTAGREPSMQLFAAGDSVFLDVSDPALRAGQTYLIYRVDGEVSHPLSGQVVGDAINLLGRIELIQVDGTRGIGRISETCAEIEVGDHLHPLIEDSVAGDADFPALEPDFLVTELETDATVVHGYSESLSGHGSGDRRVLGRWQTYSIGDVVTIDQGVNHDWQPNSRVLIYATRPEAASPGDRSKTDPVVQAQGMVIYSLEQTAVVMITDGAGTVRVGSRARRIAE